MFDAIKRFWRRILPSSIEPLDAQKQIVQDPLNAQSDGFSQRIDSILKANDEIHVETDKLAKQIEAIQSQLNSLKSQIARAETSANLNAIPTLLSELKLKPSYLRQSLRFPIFNPGVIQIDDDICFLSRSSNLIVHDDNRANYYIEPPHNTVNVFHRYDRDLNFLQSAMLDDSLLRSRCPEAQYGVEDARLFIWKNELWAVCAGVAKYSDIGLMTTQILIKIAHDTIVDFVVLRSPINARHEKNWIPVIDGDRLFLIYSYVPLAVFEVLGQNIVLRYGALPGNNNAEIRGGTPLLKWGENGYIGIVHSRGIRSGGKSYYPHNFIVMNDSFEIVEISSPFFFQRKGIEFACGLLLFEDKLLVSYGVSDRAAAFALIPVEVVTPWVIGMAGAHPQSSRGAISRDVARS